MKTKLILNSQNIVNYLTECSFFSSTEKDNLILESVPVETKNFNLLVTLPNQKKILVKQERNRLKENVSSEFANEWKIKCFLNKFKIVDYLDTLFPEILHFDSGNSILIFNYLSNYTDLEIFYKKRHDFSVEIALVIGTAIATIHRETFNSQQYQNFFSQCSESCRGKQSLKSLSSLEHIGPEVFGSFPIEGLKFIALYQRHDSLGQAIAELENAYMSCCLTHNDLKLCNILLHNDWEEQTSSKIVQLIDWECSGWGDPAHDLGTLIASYLKLWLNSLVVSKVLKIEESLRLATIPLEILQPSIAHLIQAYLKTFPTVVEHRPDFLRQVVQFSGVALIGEILSSIKYQKTFGNTGVCMLQVAKSLVCRPEASLPTILGMPAAELTQFNASSTL